MPQLTVADPSLILLLGSAGAGKSTFARRHFRPTEIISSDHCRAMICDDENEQAVNAAAFGLLHHLTRLRLEWNKLAVTTWNVIPNLKDLQGFAQKNLVDSKGLTANIPSRVSAR